MEIFFVGVMVFISMIYLGGGHYFRKKQKKKQGEKCVETYVNVCEGCTKKCAHESSVYLKSKKMMILIILIIFSNGKISASEWQIEGLLETEINISSEHIRTGEAKSKSGITLATAGIGLGRQVDANIHAAIKFRYEQADSGDIEVDEAIMTYASNGWSIKAGSLYLPFGNYQNMLISDPMTLDLGETKARAIVFILKAGEKYNLEYQAYIYDGQNGLQDKHLRKGGVSIVSRISDEITLGAGSLSNMSDTNAGFAEEWKDDFNIGGNIFLQMKFGKFDLAAETVAVLKSFSRQLTDIDDNSSEIRPTAVNIEAGYNFTDKSIFALRLAWSRDWAEMPILQLGAAVTENITENVIAGFEYIFNKYATDSYVDDTGIKNIHSLKAKAGIYF